MKTRRPTGTPTPAPIANLFVDYYEESVEETSGRFKEVLYSGFDYYIVVKNS